MRLHFLFSCRPDDGAEVPCPWCGKRAMRTAVVLFQAAVYCPLLVADRWFTRDGGRL